MTKHIKLDLKTKKNTFTQPNTGFPCLKKPITQLDFKTKKLRRIAKL